MKIQNLSEFLNNVIPKFYSPSEHLAVVKVTVLYKERVLF